MVERSTSGPIIVTRYTDVGMIKARQTHRGILAIRSRAPSFHLSSSRSAEAYGQVAGGVESQVLALARRDIHSNPSPLHHHHHHTGVCSGGSRVADNQAQHPGAKCEDSSMPLP